MYTEFSETKAISAVFTKDMKQMKEVRKEDVTLKPSIIWQRIPPSHRLRQIAITFWTGIDESAAHRTVSSQQHVMDTPYISTNLSIHKLIPAADWVLTSSAFFRFSLKIK